MRYWPVFLLIAGVMLIGYFSLKGQPSSVIIEAILPSTDTRTVNASAFVHQTKYTRQPKVGTSAAVQQASTINTELPDIQDASNIDIYIEHTEIDLVQQAQLFADKSLEKGSFSVDEIDAMLLSESFDELAGYLPYRHDDDIQVRLDIEQRLANTFADGAVINNINCGGYICLMSIDAGNNEDIESIVNKAISADDKVKTVFYRSVVSNGQNQLRAVFSYSDKINAIVVATKKTSS